MIREVSVKDRDVLALIAKLDEFQLSLYGIEGCNLESASELLENKAYILGAFNEGVLEGIGSLKLCGSYAEIKRMYFEEAHRSTGMAVELIKGLEEYAITNRVPQIYLETGCFQKAAIKFYSKHGYDVVESFGKYQPNEVSIYMGKSLNTGTLANTSKVND